MQRKISQDFTAESEFTGLFAQWTMKKVNEGEVNMIPGKDVGIKTDDDEPITIAELLGTTPKVTIIVWHMDTGRGCSLAS